MANTRKKVRTAAINLRLPPGERRAIELLTIRGGRGTLSDTVRALIREGIERRGIEIFGMSEEDTATIEALLAKYRLGERTK